MGDSALERRIDTGTEVLRAEVSGGVGLITLNRPERRNALHRDMYPAVFTALDEFSTADDVTCIVVTGAGTAFCAGGDVRDGRRRPEGDRPPTIDEAAAALHADAQIAQRLHESPKLTVAAVNGPAVGAGLSIALACDLRIVAPTAKLITGWARLAFSGDFGGTWFLTRLVGPSRAIELLATNETVTAQRAVELGLANHLTAGEDFEAEWRAWLSPIATGPRDAMAAMKANVHEALVEPLSTALVDESRRMVLSGRTEDHRRAVRAWLDGRQPDFGHRT